MAESEERDSKRQAVALELSSAVFGHTGTLRAILSLVGAGHFVYVAGTCTSWRAAYTKALEGVLSGSRASRGKPVCVQGTSYAAVFCSPSRLRMAVNDGLELGKGLREAAGRYADLETLQLAAELGLTMTTDVMYGALRCGLSSIPKMAWLLDVKTVPLGPDVIEAALSAQAPIEVLRWLHARGADWNEYSMSIAAQRGPVTTLQFLRSIGCAWDTGAPNSAARRGYLPALKYLLQEGCPFNAEQIADEAAQCGDVDMLKWLYTERDVPFTIDAPFYAAGHGHVNALRYLVTEIGCETGFQTWVGALTNGFLSVLQFLLEHCPEHLEPRLYNDICFFHRDVEALKLIRWLHETAHCPWDIVQLARRAVEHDHLEVLAYLKEQGGSMVYAASDCSTAVRWHD